jgi:hypothetical protein
MKTLLQGWFLVAMLVATSHAMAQQNSAQDWDGSGWVTANTGTLKGTSVTKQVEDTITYWVVWQGSVKAMRFRLDDPSLSTEESDLLKDLHQNGGGVEVTISSGPEVQSVTETP